MVSVSLKNRCSVPETYVFKEYATFYESNAYFARWRTIWIIKRSHKSLHMSTRRWRQIHSGHFDRIEMKATDMSKSVSRGIARIGCIRETCTVRIYRWHRRGVGHSSRRRVWVWIGFEPFFQLTMGRPLFTWAMQWPPILKSRFCAFRIALWLVFLARRL